MSARNKNLQNRKLHHETYLIIDKLQMTKISNHDEIANCRLDLNTKKILRFARKFYKQVLEEKYELTKLHKTALRQKNLVKPFLEYTDQLVESMFDENLLCLF